MLTRARTQLTRTAIAAPLVAIIGFAAFGSGYRATQVAQHDGSATLAKGHTVVHVNGETGRPDAEVAREMATGRQRLEVVQTPSGAVYVVNTATGVVTSIDTTTMQPDAKRKPAGRASSVQVVTGGHDTYVIDRRRGLVDLVDPKGLTTRRTVSVTPGIKDAVVDGGGTAWVLGRDGQVRRIVAGQQREVIPAGGGGSRLTLVGDRPMVVDADAAAARQLDRGGADQALRLPIPAGSRLELSAPSNVGTSAWIVLEDSGELVRVPVHGGKVQTEPLGDIATGADFGPPVADSGRVYVPDYTHRAVLVLDADMLRLEKRVPVPGDSPAFDVFVRNGKVWINDPYARQAVAIAADGHHVEVDKGSGHAVTSSAESVGDNPAPPATRRRDPAATQPEPAPRHDPDPDDSPPPGRQAPRPAVRQPEPRIEVPPVVGLRHEQACNRLHAAGLNCRPIPVPSGLGRKPGEVVRTDPQAGSRVGRAYRVIVEWLQPPATPQGVPAPLVTGRNITEACATLRRAALECEAISLGPVNGQPQNAFVVVDQAPAASTELAPGTHVQIRHYGNPIVPEVRGRHREQACAELAVAHLQCQQVPGDVPSRPDIVHLQSQAAGAGVAEGALVQVIYDDTPTAPVLRLKRAGHNVWVVTTNQAHADRLLARQEPGQHGTYLTPDTIGWAFAPTTPVTGTLKQLYSFHQRDESLGGNNIQYTDDRSVDSRHPSWVYQGVAAVVFNQPYGGTVPLLRFTKDGTYAYATGAQDIGWYTGRGYGNPATIGWVWPTP
jgi:hypothetical protein